MSRLTITAEKFNYCRDYCNAGDCQYKAGIIPEKCLDAMLYEKLRDYEDTGLEPEEIRELLYDSTGPLHKKLGKWIKAESEGRLLILPCKVGTEVYRLMPGKCDHAKNDTCIPHRDGYCGGYVTKCLKYKAAKEVVKVHSTMADLANIGRTVFLTREEADAALKEVDDG